MSARPLGPSRRNVLALAALLGPAPNQPETWISQSAASPGLISEICAICWRKGASSRAYRKGMTSAPNENPISATSSQSHLR